MSREHSLTRPVSLLSYALRTHDSIYLAKVKYVFNFLKSSYQI